METPESYTNTIDTLLQRYLLLLDEYTRLRTSLSSAQADVFHQLARANFARERGMRYYGQDHYDERMQAVRTLKIRSATATTSNEAVGTGDCPVFEVVNKHAAAAAAATPSGKDREEKKKSSSSESSPPDSCKEDQEEEEKDATTLSSDMQGLDLGDDEKQKEDEKHTKKEKKRHNDDPLRWFGLLTPPSLRTAQAKSIHVVEDIIPRLVSVNAEMATVEIEVRRARKKREKALALAAKETPQEGRGGESVAVNV